MPKAILEFREHRADVTLHLAEMETPKQLDAVAEGRLDIGFIRPRPSYPLGVVAKILRQEKLLLTVPASHRLAGSGNITSLSAETFIFPQLDERAGFNEYVADFVASVRLAPRNTHRVRDFLTAISLVAGGCGVALVPESLGCLSMANVVYRNIDNYDRSVGLAVAYRASESAPVVQASVDICNHLRP
jgi:DNA-binding transcriptional LysR family regulator